MLWSGLLNTRSVCYACDGPDARDRGVARPVRLCARCCLLLWAAGVAIHAVSFVFVRFLVCVCVCVCGCLLPLLTMLLCVDCSGTSTCLHVHAHVLMFVVLMFRDVGALIHMYPCPFLIQQSINRL